MDAPTTLHQLLSAFPGTTEDILKYKKAIVSTIYKLGSPSFTELAAEVKSNARRFDIDLADPKFTRNMVYCVAVLRAEKIIRREYADEDVFMIEDNIRHMLDRMFDPSPELNQLAAEADTLAAPNPCLQSMFMTIPPPPSGPPPAPPSAPPSAPPTTPPPVPTQCMIL